MKVIVITWAAATLGTVSGQTPATPAVQPAEMRQSETFSSRELNTKAYIELLRSDLKNTKSQVVGQIMQLDAAQAAKFWPIYKDCEAELTGIGDQIVALVRNYITNYTKMTDAKADELAMKLLDIEQKRGELKRKYYLRMKDGLDSITAARFLQVENQLEKLIDLQIASELPVISEQ